MIVYSTVYSGVDQSKHQSSASLAFVWGIHRWPVNSPHKWPVTRKMFPLDNAIMRVLFSSKVLTKVWNSAGRKQKTIVLITDIKHYHDGTWFWMIHFSKYSFDNLILIDLPTRSPLWLTIRWRHMSIMTSEVNETWLFIKQFVLVNSKEESKFRITGPLWGKCTGDHWFSPQRVSNADSVSKS